MSDAPKPAAAPLPTGNSSAEISARVNAMQEENTALEKEVKILEGKLANRNPAQAKAIKAENDQLRARVKRLEKALFALMLDGMKPRSPEDMQTRNEALRDASVMLYEKLKLDPNLWKSIAS
jgi:predicted nuclease with TOPRIM domain